MEKNKTYFRELNKIAIPLILSSITSTLMALVDQAFVGHISLEAFAGVGLIFSCINSITGVLGAFSIVFHIGGSRFMGENDRHGLDEEFTIFILLSLVLGGGLAILFTVFSLPILLIVFELKESTLYEATSYLQVYSLTIPLNLILFLYNTVFKITRKTRHIFYTTVFVNFMNIVLDYAFIFGKLGLPALGSRGAAIGTVLALFINLILYIYIARHDIHFTWKIKKKFSKIYIKFKAGIPFLIQEALEDIVIIVGLNMLVARLGTIELSTYNLIVQIVAVVQMPMFGYAAEVLSLGSEKFAKKKYHEIKIIRKEVRCLLIGWFGILYVLIMLNINLIVNVISGDADLLAHVVKCIPIALGIQVIQYGICIEKSILQFSGYEKYVLYGTFLINLLDMAAICFIASTLNAIYIGLGIGSFLIFLTFIRKNEKVLTLRDEK